MIVVLIWGKLRCGNVNTVKRCGINIHVTCVIISGSDLILKSRPGGNRLKNLHENNQLLQYIKYCFSTRFKTVSTVSEGGNLCTGFKWCKKCLDGKNVNSSENLISPAQN